MWKNILFLKNETIEPYLGSITVQIGVQEKPLRRNNRAINIKINAKPIQRIMDLTMKMEKKLEQK